MLCQFERLLYPKNISGMQLGSYMIALYRPCERVVDGGGNRVMQIKAAMDYRLRAAFVTILRDIGTETRNTEFSSKSRITRKS